MSISRCRCFSHSPEVPARRFLPRALTVKVMDDTVPLPVSARVQATDEPCIVKTKAMMAGVDDVLSLAQGVVHWQPPEQAVAAAQAACATQLAHSYGPANGSPDLVEALRTKVKDENGLEKVDIMVTAGANQAFVNIVLTLLDETDSVVLFKPYYFNHLMAIQMTGGGSKVLFGPAGDALKPDLEWLEATLASEQAPKMVVIVNPCNPAGFVMSAAELERAAAMTKARGCWLVVDNTYEHFTYGVEHACVSGSNVVNIFSFSKAYGMMGWRVGYLCYPDATVHATLGAEILKVQDTIPICPTQLSQLVALEALNEGREWVMQRVSTLSRNRRLALDALQSVLGEGSVAAKEGAIYFLAKLPEGMDDEAVVERLIKECRVTLIPGASCGMPGYIRVAYANCSEKDCEEACQRLSSGLTALVAEANDA